MKYLSQKNRFWRHLPTYPLILSSVIPMLILDLWIEMYHRFCFPFYSIPHIKRKEYIKIDRHKLKYLNGLQKLNCIYCGYANGVVKYWMKIFAETEIYWCGIQHEGDAQFNAPEHHTSLITYGDEESFRKLLKNQRNPII